MKMSENLKQPVVVENRPGANGLLGAGAVAQAPADGYTMLLTDRGALGVNPSLYKSMPYDPTRDFAYVGIVTVAPYVLVVDPKLPVKTVGELVAHAKANPGKLNYGRRSSRGPASTSSTCRTKAPGPRCKAWWRANRR